MESPIIKTRNFSAFFGKKRILNKVNISIPKNQVTSVMGPSGCGKTTFIRCINRMHELTEGAKTEGVIMYYKNNINKMFPILLRRKIGMVFQRPNPFPTMSLFDNVIAGYKLNGLKLKQAEKEEIVERSLKSVYLWDEIKDNLHDRGTFLSGGQQQRLCIARTLAMKPDVILLDEPTSALDPISTSKLEELIVQLKENYSLILVTHNMQQAARISDKTAFFHKGELMEFDETKLLFTNPKNKKTQDYITGRFS